MFTWLGTASDVGVNSISISDVTVDQTGRSGVNFNPRVGRRRRRRRRRTDGRDERPVESLDASIKQTAAENGEGRRGAGRLDRQASGEHITGQMSDDRTLDQAYISLRPALPATASASLPAAASATVSRRAHCPGRPRQARTGHSTPGTALISRARRAPWPSSCHVGWSRSVADCSDR